MFAATQTGGYVDYRTIDTADGDTPATSISVVIRRRDCNDSLVYIHQLIRVGNCRTVAAVGSSQGTTDLFTTPRRLRLRGIKASTTIAQQDITGRAHRKARRSLKTQTTGPDSTRTMVNVAGTETDIRTAITATVRIVTTSDFVIHNRPTQ